MLCIISGQGDVGCTRLPLCGGLHTDPHFKHEVPVRRPQTQTLRLSLRWAWGVLDLHPSQGVGQSPPRGPFQPQGTQRPVPLASLTLLNPQLHCFSRLLQKNRGTSDLWLLLHSLQASLKPPSPKERNWERANTTWKFHRLSCHRYFPSSLKWPTISYSLDFKVIYI